MKKIRNGILITLLMSLLFIFPVHAEEVEKNIEVTLSQSYVQCSFYITFEKEIGEDVTLITPKGEEYKFSEDLVDSSKLKCTIKSAKPGDYTIRIRKNNPNTEESDETTEKTDNIDTSNLSDEVNEFLNSSSSEEEILANTVIGKVTVTVKAEDEATTSAITDNMKLAKEIDGLKIYWKDDDIVVEWTDTTVENVNVSVTDSGNLQKIASEKVTGNSFSCTISQNIKQIIVYIVPAESSKINGAGDEYLIDVDNHPDGTIDIEPYEYVNTDTIQAVANLNEPYSLLFTNNDKEVGSTEILEAGSHDIEIPTVIGENNVKVYIVDEKGNMRSTSVSFIKDIESPILKIEDDINGASTYDNSITFNGNVSDFDNLTFRNEGVLVDWDGSFEIYASLKEGANDIDLVATDLAGNQTTYHAVVTMLVKQEKEVPWKSIILCVVAVIILLLFFIKKKIGPIHREPKEHEEEKEPKNVVYHRPVNIKDYICFAVLIVVVIILLQVVFNISVVSSGSMEPTIKTNEIVVANRLAYKAKSVGRGDIVICNAGDSNEPMLKRVIGLPGDTVTFIDGYVFINGVICDESAYLDESVETNSTNSYIVPENSYFLLGDNREDSIDSRYWINSCVTRDNLIGKIIIHINFS